MGTQSWHPIAKILPLIPRVMEASTSVRVSALNARWQETPCPESTHVIAAHQAATVSSHLILSKRASTVAAEASAVVETHHLDFNMIEHGDSFVLSGCEQAHQALMEPVEMGIEMTTISQFDARRERVQGA